MSDGDSRMFRKLRSQWGAGDYNLQQRSSNEARQFSGSEESSSAVDRLLDQKLLNDLRKQAPPPVVSKPGRSRIPSAKDSQPSSGASEVDADLLSSMVRRLAAAEKELKMSNQQLLRVRGERDILRDRVEELEQDLRERDEQLAEAAHQDTMRGEEPANAVDIIAQLRTENLRLRQQNDRAWNEVGHLKEFLSDYGLVWVGDKDAGSDDASSSDEPDGSAAEDAPVISPSSSSTKELPFDMAGLEAAVKELNHVAGDGCFDVVRGSGGEAQLRAPEPISMVVYADGICLHTLKFCKYDEKVCKSLLQDILDGYFPSALKHEFPDGVPIRIVDKSRERYPVGFRPFQGRGQVLAAASKPNASGGYTLGSKDQPAKPSPIAQPNPSNIYGMNNMQEAARQPQNAQQFLDKLPQVVIRNGKVIPIRSDVAAIIQPAKAQHEMAFVRTPVDDLLNTTQRHHPGPRLPNLSPTSSKQRHLQTTSHHEVTTLQVKREDGGEVYIIKLRFTDTIKDLRDALDTHRRGNPQFAMSSYEIRSAFPAKAYDDTAITLKAAGLVPNATLFLRSV